jgi:hypothetical protein
MNIDQTLMLNLLYMNKQLTEVLLELQQEQWVPMYSVGAMEEVRELEEEQLTLQARIMWMISLKEQSEQEECRNRKWEEKLERVLPEEDRIGLLRLRT